MARGRPARHRICSRDEFDVWQKDYNDTITGLSWNYPEFKGFHDKVYWAELATRNLPIKFINHSDDIALRVFTPREAGGEGFEITGHHEIMVPLLCWAVVTELERASGGSVPGERPENV